ncbi:hypothetical protein [uncultured Halomonas sp.]|uniref:hypothetical protein n=1 Tax=uncultured Halomonas sp. TaxID=173971 RepID=UPI0025974D31|nr:hypothetical protein [uncultured Halomonas sp.]|tara:strand:+ start:5316 stop:5576 length:261 start_codon:yes stop_codon:yes gene_type:complete
MDYMTRAMQSRDPRFARILGKLGYERRDMVAKEPADVEPESETPPKDDLDELRAIYRDISGASPDKRWGLETLRAKISKARNDDSQ